MRSWTLCALVVLSCPMHAGYDEEPEPPSQRAVEEAWKRADQAVQHSVAARAPCTWPFILFLLSILLPLAAGIRLIFRAEHFQLGHDEQLRWLIRSGMTPTVIHAYLEPSHRPRLRGPQGPQLTSLRRPRGTCSSSSSL